MQGCVYIFMYVFAYMYMFLHQSSEEVVIVFSEALSVLLSRGSFQCVLPRAISLLPVSNCTFITLLLFFWYFNSKCILTDLFFSDNKYLLSLTCYDYFFGKMSAITTKAFL